MDFRAVAVCTASGRWHVAQQNMLSGVVLTPEACNLDDAVRLEVYPDLPDGVKASELCKRCHPTVAE